MHQQFGWIWLVSLFATACDGELEDLIVDAASPHADAPDASTTAGEECRRTDQEVATKISAADASVRTELASCTKDEDCTTWEPIFRCEERRIQLTQCGVPLTVGKLEAATRWLDQLEQELCPHLAENCHGGASCVGGTLHCIGERCTLVR